MKTIIIATPSYDGKLEVWYVNSLVNTIKLGVEKQVNVFPVYITYDALVQRARNDLFKIAAEAEIDALFFIDADMEWDPQWVFNFLEAPEEIIGAPVIKKSFNESYNIKLLNKELKYNTLGTLIEVDSVGTGFLKVAKSAVDILYKEAEEYGTDGKKAKMVFNIGINEDGDLVSEDNILCEKWKKMGNKVWVDPNITCPHVGVHKFEGDFKSFLTKLEYK